MPLIDLESLPPGRREPWESIHQGWATRIAFHLNGGRLPHRYHASMNLHAGAVEFGALDVYEVPVCDTEGTRALVAAIELISPGSKDRPSHREAFVTKCAAYLQQNVSVIIVDIITSRRANPHAELMARLQMDEEARRAITVDLYACAYRTSGVGTRTRLEAWSTGTDDRTTLADAATLACARSGRAP